MVSHFFKFHGIMMLGANILTDVTNKIDLSLHRILFVKYTYHTQFKDPAENVV